MTLEVIIAGIMIVALIFYALLGGADYGGGVWDLFAFGKRAREQRELIAKALSPVWEANHVWLILVIVILFNAFPPAFSAISIALHIPLTLLLIGIILRGTAFTFRHYDTQKDKVQRRWSLIFSIASLITPILLGVTLGAIASGTIRVENDVVTTGFINSWFAPKTFGVGIGRKLDQVVVTGQIFGHQNDVIGGFVAGLKVRSSLFQTAAASDVSFDPNDRLDALGLHFIVERKRAK